MTDNYFKVTRGASIQRIFYFDDERREDISQAFRQATSYHERERDAEADVRLVVWRKNDETPLMWLTPWCWVPTVGQFVAAPKKPSKRFTKKDGLEQLDRSVA